MQQKAVQPSRGIRAGWRNGWTPGNLKECTIPSQGEAQSPAPGEEQPEAPGRARSDPLGGTPAGKPLGHQGSHSEAHLEAAVARGMKTNNGFHECVGQKRERKENTDPPAHQQIRQEN